MRVKHAITEKRFDEIKKCEMFEFNNGYYIKAENSSSLGHNAFNVTTGTFAIFGDGTYVNALDAEIIIK